MYIVPHSAPAASAAATPRSALPPGAWADDARDAERDELGGRLGGAGPGAGGEPGQDADALQAGEARRVELGQAIHRSTNRPAMSTASGIHKWTSPSRARQRETVVGCTGSLA